MKVKFICLASGSSGNCYYLGTGTCGILIDAGIGSRTLRKALKQFELPIENIRAIFITHDHSDHIKGVGYLGDKLHIPVYATALTHAGIDRNYHTGDKLSAASVRHIEKGVPIKIDCFCIECFEVPHDGTDNVGYCIETDGKVFSFLTDLGEITPMAAQYIRKANYLVLEANYDEQMLHTGKYPAYLKRRIAGPTGHMSNSDTANFLAENFSPHLHYIWLCHLSKDNNSPELAYETVAKKLDEKGISIGRDVQLIALRRNTPSELYIFE